MSSYPPPPPPPRRDLHNPHELAETIPGAVPHEVYEGQPPPREARLDVNGLPPLAPPPPSDASAWNAPAYGLLALFLLALAALLYPQYRARATEHKINPLIAGLSTKPADTARCPRYITAIFTNVGSVRLDANGAPSDHTDLTGPICDAMRHFYTDAGKAEMGCLLTDGRCPDSALASVVALSTIAHESMHLKGILDEAQAECASIGSGDALAQFTGLSAEQGRMISYLHLMAMNPNTPERYNLSIDNCPSAAPLVHQPPGNEAARAVLEPAVAHTWLTLGD